jgi:hypothetical protein
MRRKKAVPESTDSSKATLASRVSADRDRMVQLEEIRWTLEPRARLEDLSGEDLLALDPGELLTYAADCRDDLRAVRDTLHQALAFIARQQDQITRATRIIEWQRQQLRDGRVAA